MQYYYHTFVVELMQVLIFLFLTFPVSAYDFELDYFGERINCSAFNQMSYYDVSRNAQLGVELDVCLDSSPIDLPYLLELAEYTSVRFFVGHTFSYDSLKRLAGITKTDDTLYLRTSDTNLEIDEIETLTSIGNVELLIDSRGYYYPYIERIIGSVRYVRIDTRTSVKLDYPEFIMLNDKAVSLGTYLVFLIDVNDLGGKLNLNHNDLRLLRSKKVNIVLR